MKRVLLVSFYFPPNQAIGSVRPMGLRKYLPQTGWECFVLTPALKSGEREDVQVIETGYVDVFEAWKRRLRLNPAKTLHSQLKLPEATRANTRHAHTFLIAQLKQVIAFPDPMKGWLRFACEKIDQLKTHNFDAVITTAPPPSAHVIGRYAKKTLKCPWVADFRDLWTQNLEKRLPILRPVERRLERKLLAQADAVVTVSDDWASQLRTAYPRAPVHTVTNGFDPENFPHGETKLTDRFTITYAGLLYQGKRDPGLLLEALRELLQEGLIQRGRLCLRFYGPIEPWFTTRVQKLGLSDVLEAPGVISRQAALERQRESQLLLQLGWYDQREKGQHTGKLFEYLGSRRPIVAVGGAPGAMSEVLEHTQAGVHLQTKSEVKEYLLACYREYESEGQIRYQGQEDAIMQYSHMEMAKRYAEILDGVVKSRQVGFDSNGAEWLAPQLTGSR
jgi:hypothetical protein